MSTAGERDVVAEYRAAVAEMTADVVGDTARNDQRVDELRALVKALDRELVEASELHVATRVGNLLAWEEALEVLWVESWMTMRPFPRPDRLASGADAATSIADVEAALAALRAAVGRGPLRLSRRR